MRPTNNKSHLPAEKPFYKKWDFWILGVAIILLMSYQIFSNDKSSKKFEEIFGRLTDYEQSHVPLEEIKVELPSKKIHENINETFTAKIPFSYSGEKTVSYFVDWKAINTQGTNDNIAPLSNAAIQSISYVNEKEGKKFVEKEYRFLKADTYTINVNFTYYIGSDDNLGNNEEEIKNKIRTSNISKSRAVSFEVVVR